MTQKRGKHTKSGWRLMLEYGSVVLIAAGIALFLRAYVIETFRMPSRSMTPTVQPGDTLFVRKWRWKLKRNPEPHLGEVVVFQFESEPGRNYIKRVVGLPGDTIAITDGILTRNGVRVTQLEPHGEEPCKTEELSAIHKYTICIEEPKITLDEPIIVPLGYAFVLGDLRSLTQEIRKPKTHGLVPFHLISGTAWLIWLSVQPSNSGGTFSRIEFSRMFKGIY